MNDAVTFVVGTIVAILIIISGSIWLNDAIAAPQNTHDTKMANGQSLEQFVLSTSMQFFNAGCVDAFDKLKQDNAHIYCDARTAELGKEVAKRMKAK